MLRSRRPPSRLCQESQRRLFFCPTRLWSGRPPSPFSALSNRILSCPHASPPHAAISAPDPGRRLLATQSFVTDFVRRDGSSYCTTRILARGYDIIAPSAANGRPRPRASKFTSQSHAEWQQLYASALDKARVLRRSMTQHWRRCYMSLTLSFLQTWLEQQNITSSAPPSRSSDPTPIPDDHGHRRAGPQGTAGARGLHDANADPGAEGSGGFRRATEEATERGGSEPGLYLTNPRTQAGRHRQGKGKEERTRAEIRRPKNVQSDTKNPPVPKRINGEPLLPRFSPLRENGDVSTGTSHRRACLYERLFWLPC